MAYLPPLNGGRINATISGNTSGAGSLVSTGTLTLAGGNNITLSQAGNAISISGPSISSISATGALSVSVNGSTVSMGAPIVGLGMNTSTAGGGTGGTSGTVSNGLQLFAGTNVTLSQSTNSNGASVSMYAGGGGGSINFSASNTSANLASMTFSNSNGVSFGLNAGVITASHNGLTSQSNQALSASNGSFAFQTAGFSNANGVTFGTSAGSIMTASVNTSYAASNHSHGNPTLNLTNLSGTTASASNGLTLSLSAAAQTAQTANLYVSSNSTQLSSTAGIDLRSVTFQGAGNVSIGVSQGKVLVSGAGGAGGGVALYDGAASISSGTASISAAGALTASINGQTLSLSAPVVSSLSATGAVSISNNGGTISIGAPTQTNQTANFYVSSNSTQLSSTAGIDLRSVTYQGAGAASVGLSQGKVLVSVPTQTNQTLGLYAVSNTTQSTSGTVDARTLSFQGAGAASVGVSNGSVIISAPNAAAGNVTFSAGGNSAGLASLVFSNSNGVSFGLNGSTITASAAGGGGGVNIAASNTTFTSGTVVMSNNGGALTISSGNQSVLFSVPATSSLAVTGGLSASTNGSTISLGVPGLMSNWLHNSAAFYSSTTGNMINGTASVARMLIPAHISFTRVDIPVSISVTTAANANTAGMAISAVGVIYSRNGSTLNPIVGQSSTSSYSYASSTGVYSSITGPRVVSFNMATTLSAGEYYFGFQLSSAASSMGTATTNPGWAVAPVYGTSYSAAPWSDMSAAPSQTVHLLQPLQGINSVMVTNTTMTMQQSQISQSGGTSGGARGNFIVAFRNN